MMRFRRINRFFKRQLNISVNKVFQIEMMSPGEE
jgi:hypothetical protein